ELQPDDRLAGCALAAQQRDVVQRDAVAHCPLSLGHWGVLPLGEIEEPQRWRWWWHRRRWRQWRRRRRQRRRRSQWRARLPPAGRQSGIEWRHGRGPPGGPG